MDKQSRKTRWLKKQAAFYPLKPGPMRSAAARGAELLPAQRCSSSASPFPPSSSFPCTLSHQLYYLSLPARSLSGPHKRRLRLVCPQIANETRAKECALVSLQQRTQNTGMGLLPAERCPQEGTGAQPVPKPAGTAVGRGWSAESAGSPPCIISASTASKIFLGREFPAASGAAQQPEVLAGRRAVPAQNSSLVSLASATARDIPKPQGQEGMGPPNTPRTSQGTDPAPDQALSPPALSSPPAQRGRQIRCLENALPKTVEVVTMEIKKGSTAQLHQNIYFSPRVSQATY